VAETVAGQRSTFSSIFEFLNGLKAAITHAPRAPRIFPGFAARGQLKFSGPRLFFDFHLAIGQNPPA